MRVVRLDRVGPLLVLAAAALFSLVACSSGQDKQPPGPRPDKDDTDTDEPIDTSPPIDTGEEKPPEFDCSAAPMGPYTRREITAWNVEDLAFDDQGNLVGNDWSHVYKTDYNGNRTIFVPNLNFRAGMRMLSTGELIIANDNQGELVKVQPDGSYSTLLSGLAYPNGIEIGLDDFIYVTEHDGNRVRRVDPTNGDHTVISNGLIQNPNGITFNEDFTALYIGGFSGVGYIYKLPIDKNGNPGKMELWASGVGSGWLDGMAVDYCGNLYIADYSVSQILRYTPNGQFESYVVNGVSYYMANMQWGSGIGGWDPLKLYIVDGNTENRTIELDLGIPSKPR
ncbi:MAG: hypothetical protein HN348_01235 [Proteobacteria bacterium]|nr:hypothetical protein [Pseudomonadota bacterium]